MSLKQPTLNMMLQGMAAAAAGHPGSLHHALQSPPNSNAAAINPAGGFLFLPQNPNAGMQGQQMHPGKSFDYSKNLNCRIYNKTKQHIILMSQLPCIFRERPVS